MEEAEQDLRFTRKELDLMMMGLLHQHMQALIAHYKTVAEATMVTGAQLDEARQMMEFALGMIARCDVTAKHGLKDEPGDELDQVIDTTRSLVEEIVTEVAVAEAESGRGRVHVHGGFVREGDLAWATTIQGKVLMVQVETIVTPAQIYCIEVNKDGSPVSLEEVMLRQDALYTTQEAAIAAAKDQAKWRASLEKPA